MTSLYRTTNPMTGEVVSEYDTITDQDLRSALAMSEVSFRRWSKCRVHDRAQVLLRIAELHRKYADELASLSTLEMGKPRAQALAEVELAASIFEYYGHHGPGLLADEELDIAGEGSAVVKTAPIGTLLGIMPWNFPYYQVARFVAPNLVLGNTVMLKHASNCPQQALRIRDLVAEAAPEADVYINVFATNEQVSEVIASPVIQGVSLTGSERAGISVGRLAGQNLKKSVLELGGSDALIVLADADLERAVTAAVAGRYLNAGQACTSAKRIIVVDTVWDQFITSYVEQARRWECGDPDDMSTKMGPMASRSARDELAAQVEDALAKGAVALVGGWTPEGDAAFYPATVLTGVTPDMRAFHEELFGPVAVLYRVSGPAEAVDLANNSPFGLGGAVFTASDKLAQWVVDGLDVGMVGVNAMVKSAPGLPFGGIKRSGIGRELGRFGLDEFANKKLVRFAERSTASQ